MFRQLLHRLTLILLRLKVTFLSPPPFPSLSSIMSHQATIYTHLILRLNLPQCNYEKSQLSLGFSKQRLGVLFTASKWTATLVGYLSFFGYLPTYNVIFERSYRLENYATISLSISLIFTFVEYFWATQLGPLLSSSRNDALTLLYVFADPSKSSGLSTNQVTKLIKAFNRQHRIAVRYMGFSIFIILLHLPGLLSVPFISGPGSGFSGPGSGLSGLDSGLSNPGFGFYGPGSSFSGPDPGFSGPDSGLSGLNLPEKLWNTFLALNTALQGLYGVVFGVTCGNQAFLLIRLFKIKLQNVLRQATPTTWRPFTFAFYSLNRQMVAYNTFLSAFIFMADLSLKLSGSVVIIDFYDSGRIFSSTIALTVSVILAISWISVNVIFSLFTVFSEANLKIYRRLSGVYVRKHLGKDGKRLRERRNVRKALELNGFLGFLASCQFGFTYGSLFVIEKQSLLENVCSTLFYFLLFLKKRV